MDMTKSPPARGGLTHPDDRGPEGWVTATHCPPLGGGMELPPQGVARGWTPGFLPLLRGWGTNPRGGGKRTVGMGWEEEERLARRKAKQHPVPGGGQCLCVGGGGNRRSCSPFGGRTAEGE